MSTISAEDVGQTTIRRGSTITTTQLSETLLIPDALNTELSSAMKVEHHETTVSGSRRMIICSNDELRRSQFASKDVETASQVSGKQNVEDTVSPSKQNDAAFQKKANDDSITKSTRDTKTTVALDAFPISSTPTTPVDYGTSDAFASQPGTSLSGPAIFGTLSHTNIYKTHQKGDYY
ncbi:hypothetical protein KIN20_010645 [Parelaphostrongylus tenuis]|uniref:Uncharacterized protein n=1 Tax=Parelaphostrongylus tenuis TaxID=148309 RepID=A0AAD5QP98_PARTN|nr:hypothetical protein KIN20_010645 [Parelaphostrongylus tenuis]